MRNFFLCLLLGIFCVGCAASGSNFQKDTMNRDKAQMLIADLFAAYRVNDIYGHFSAKLDETLLPSKGAYLDAVSRAYPAQGIVEMSAVVDSVQGTWTAMNAEISWQKKYAVPGSGLVLKTGKARLLFRARDNTWLLANVVGEDPFKL